MDINEIITTEAVQCVELKDYFFAYQLLSQSFARQWHLKTLLSDADGVDVFGDSRFGGELRQDRREAIAAAVKRGGCCGRQSARRPAIMIYAVPPDVQRQAAGGRSGGIRLGHRFPDCGS